MNNWKLVVGDRLCQIPSKLCLKTETLLLSNKQGDWLGIQHCLSQTMNKLHHPCLHPYVGSDPQKALNILRRNMGQVQGKHWGIIKPNLRARQRNSSRTSWISGQTKVICVILWRAFYECNLPRQGSCLCPLLIFFSLVILQSFHWLQWQCHEAMDWL